MSGGSQWSITESAREDHHSGNELDHSGTTGLTQDDSSRTQSNVNNNCNKVNFVSTSDPSKLLSPTRFNYVDAHKMASDEEEDVMPMQPTTAAIPETPALLGMLEFSLYYDSRQQSLRCIVHRAKGLPAMDRNGLSDPYVKLHLLPGATKSTKLRTKTILKNRNPEWNESLEYHGVTDADMRQKSLRLSIFDKDRVGADFIGETRVALKSLQMDKLKEFSVYLSGLQVDKSDQSAPNDRGRILVSLSYDASKEQLIVGIKRCSGLLAMDSNGYSDPYVKLYLKPDKDKKTKRKTKVKSKTLNPEFNENFIYSIKAADLQKRALEVTVWDKDFGKSSDYIGGVNFDCGSAFQHWYEIIKTPNKTFEHWHLLSEKIGIESK